MAEEPIIVFENVTKEYTLYKNDADRFKALFFKPRNAKKHLALKDVSLKINQGNPSASSETTAPASLPCLK